MSKDSHTTWLGLSSAKLAEQFEEEFCRCSVRSTFGLDLPQTLVHENSVNPVPGKSAHAIARLNKRVHAHLKGVMREAPSRGALNSFIKKCLPGARADSFEKYCKLSFDGTEWHEPGKQIFEYLLRGWEPSEQKAVIEQRIDKSEVKTRDAEAWKRRLGELEKRNKILDRVIDEYFFRDWKAADGSPFFFSTRLPYPIPCTLSELAGEIIHFCRYDVTDPLAARLVFVSGYLPFFHAMERNSKSDMLSAFELALEKKIPTDLVCPLDPATFPIVEITRKPRKAKPSTPTAASITPAVFSFQAPRQADELLAQYGHHENLRRLSPDLNVPPTNVIAHFMDWHAYFSPWSRYVYMKSMKDCTLYEVRWPLEGGTANPDRENHERSPVPLTHSATSQDLRQFETWLSKIVTPEVASAATESS
jgi:hypothetical protein